jgi:hypothetical protein
MIKVVNLVALIVAPIIVVYQPLGIGGWVAVIILLGALVWAILRSKKPTQATPEPDATTASGD